MEVSKKIDFIKMDVEGYELKTFQGAQQTLEKYKPIVLFESFPTCQPEVFEFLKTVIFSSTYFLMLSKIKKVIYM